MNVGADRLILIIYKNASIYHKINNACNLKLFQIYSPDLDRMLLKIKTTFVSIFVFFV